MLRYIHAKNHKNLLILLFIAETAVLLLKLDNSLGELKDRFTSYSETGMLPNCYLVLVLSTFN
jgi:hypothetical protein